MFLWYKMSGDKRASGYVISAPVVHNNAMGLLNDQKSVIVEVITEVLFEV